MASPADRQECTPMQNLGTLDEVAEQYFRDHPDEVNDYLAEIFQDCAEKDDIVALMSSFSAQCQ